MSPDRFWVGIGTIVLVLVIMLASMVFSFAAITEAAAWTHNPPGLLFLAAVFIDGAIIAFTVSYAVRQWRRSPRARRAFVVLIIFTVLSSLVNVTHAASGWGWDFARPEMWVGMIIAGAAPVAALLSAEEITELAFTNRDETPIEQDDEDTAADTVTAPTMLEALHLVGAAPEPARERPTTSLLLPRGTRQEGAAA